MKKIIFILFIFCWNAAISQNKFVALVDKANTYVFKFTLPANVILTVNERYKIVKNKKELINYNAILLDVRNDSLFLESMDKNQNEF